MNPQSLRRLAALLITTSALAACKDDEPTKPGTIDEELPDDTGGDGGDGAGDGGDGGTPCEVAPTTVSPETGSIDVYNRGEMVIVFDADVRELAPVISLVDASGANIPVNYTFDDTGLQVVAVPASGALAPNTQHTLSAAVCDNQLQSQFTTSAYGESLTISSPDLTGLTYYFNLGDADYVQPEGLGAVLSTFLTDPLLIGVGAVDSSSIQILGTQGRMNEDTGEITRRSGFDIWDFGVASFSDSPYFESDPTDIAIIYSGVEIPMYDFRLAGTFAADGSSIGFASAEGIGDSRNMGVLVGLGSDPNAVCDLAAGFGFTCEDCPDGGRYCVRIEAYFDPSPLVEGLTLIE
jgi:hypothetical protein